MKSFLYLIRKHLANQANVKFKLRRILFSFQITVLGLVVVLFFVILDSLIGTKANVICDCVFITIVIICFYFLLKGYFYSCNLVLIVSADILLVVNGSTGGIGISNYFFWFPLACAIFIFFDLTDKKTIYSLFVLQFLSIIFLYLTRNSLLLQPNFDNSNYLKYDIPMSFTISLGLVILLAYYVLRNNYLTQRKLNKTVSKLHNSNVELVKSNAELDSFVYKASHDLRSPLTSIIGLLALMRTETDKDLLGQYIDIQEKAIQKLDNHIIDMLNISKNARLGLSVDDIDFEKVIKDIFMQYAYSDNLKIDMQVDVSISSPFYTDSKRLEIILSNLVANSVRYADFDKIKPEITIKVVANSKLANITVHDNGIGIDGELCKKVFDMFFRANTKKSGTGLGLYIVSETVQKLQGKIKLHSEIGQWTEFTLLIPNLLYKKMLENKK